MSSKSTCLIALFCFILLVACLYPHLHNYNTKFLPVWDPADHYIASVYQHKLIFDRASPLKMFWVNEFSHYYPPLVYIYTSFWYLLLPKTPLVASTSLLPILFGLMLLVYMLGRRWFAASSGFLAALLIFFSTSAIEWTRSYVLEVPLAFAVVLVLLSGERLCRKGNLTNALLFGTCVAVGFWVKWMFILYIWSALVFYIAEILIRKEWKKLVNLIIGLAFAFALMLPWYGKYGLEVAQDIFRTGLQTSLNKGFWSSVLVHSPAPFSFDAFIYYFKVLINYEWGYALIIIFLLGLLITLLKFNITRGLNPLSKRREFWLAITWFLGAFLALFILTNKQPRYFLPAIPSLALILTSWVGNVRIKFVKYLGALVIFMLCLLKPYTNPFPEDEFKPKLVVFNMPSGGEKGREFTELTRKIINDIKQDLKEGFRLHLFVLPDLSRFNSHTFYAEAIAKGIETNIALTDWLRSEPDWQPNLDYAQYVIIKDGEQGTSDVTKDNDIFKRWMLEEPPYQDCESKISNPLIKFALKNKRFTLWKKYEAPDNSKIYVYKSNYKALIQKLGPPIFIDEMTGKAILPKELEKEEGATLIGRLLPRDPKSFGKLIVLMDRRFELCEIDGKSAIFAYYIWDGNLFQWDGNLFQTYSKTEKIKENYKIFVHFEGENMKFNQDHYPLWGWYPTSAWEMSEFIMEFYIFPVPDGAHGKFDIYIGAFREDTGEVLGGKRELVGTIYITKDERGFK